MDEFNETMYNCNLNDVDFDDPAFLWRNGTMWQRLDRALTNAEWMEFAEATKVSYLSRGCMDHVPLLIRCGNMYS